jgi:hypothetical protein
MSAVIRVFEPRRLHLGGNLNMRQLLNPLFFQRDVRHPDGKRQRSSRQRAKDLAAARQLKREYVPLCYVDRTTYLETFDGYAGEWYTKEVVNA